MNDFENPEKATCHEVFGNDLGIAISENDFNFIDSILMINLTSQTNDKLSYLSFFKLPPVISSYQPPFANYLVSERRYVIMPLVFDNFCGTWIGKKNAKLYILYRLLSSISSLLILFMFMDILIYFVEDYCFGAYFYECVLICLVILSKAFFQIVLCLRIFNKIAFTKISRFVNHTNNTDKQEMYFTPSEVIGNIKCYFGENIFFWFLPIPSFSSFSDEELYSIEKKKIIYS